MIVISQKIKVKYNDNIYNEEEYDNNYSEYNYENNYKINNSKNYNNKEEKEQKFNYVDNYYDNCDFNKDGYIE